MHVSVCACACMSFHAWEGAHRNQKMDTDPLKVELQLLISHVTCVLRTGGLLQE